MTNDVLKQIVKMARDPNKCMRGDIAMFAENSMTTNPSEQAMREILAEECEKRDLKVVAGCLRSGGALICNSPKIDDAILAAMRRVAAQEPAHIPDPPYYMHGCKCGYCNSLRSVQSPEPAQQTDRNAVLDYSELRNKIASEVLGVSGWYIRRDDQHSYIGVAYQLADAVIRALKSTPQQTEDK